MYIQVSYLLANEDVTKREFVPLEAIRDNYPKMVVTMDLIPEFNRNGIIRKPVVDFLLED